MKQLVGNIRAKLELDNPERYVNGYYQMSQNQKKLWIAGLLFLAILFFALRTLLLSSKTKYLISIDVHIIIILVSAIALVLLSYVAVLLIQLCVFFVRKILNHNSDFGDATKYIMWTVVLMCAMIQIIFKIEMPFVGILLRGVNDFLNHL